MIAAIGWIGATGLLLAFVLSSRGKLDNQGIPYHLINAVCSVLLIINAYAASAYPFIVINTFWAIASCFSIGSALHRRRI